MEEFISQRTITETGPSSARADVPARSEPTLSARQHKGSRSQSPWRKPALWIAVLAVIAAVVAFALIRRSQIESQNAGEIQRTARVERKDFVRTLRVNGTVEAVETHPISAPRLAGQTSSSLTITTLITTGTHVHKGDLLVEFDRQAQVRNALDREADYNDFLRQIDKLRATQDAARASDDADIRTQEDLVRTSELEVKRGEVQSQIQAEKNKENLDEANLKLTQLRETYQLKRASDAAALKLLEIQRDSSKLAMEHAKDNSEKLAIHAPTEGMVVVNSTFKQQGFLDFMVGDNVNAGNTFMQVVNPNAMRVRAPVNQQDMPWIEQGSRAEIRLDAYPDLVFKGKTEQVSAIGVQGSFSDKVHNFTVLFSIEGTNSNLLPDLSAAVDVELERVPNALVVPRDALIQRDGRTLVRVIKGSSSEEREVKISKTNEVEAVVASGVDAGETVLRGAESEAAPAPKPPVTTARN